MTPDEEMEWCGHICMAARRMGIYCRCNPGPGGFQVIWFDTVVAQLLPCNPRPTKTAALLSACEKLVDYLSIK